MNGFSLSKLVWGLSLLAVAALVLMNHFGEFVELGIWSIMGTALALVIIISSIKNFTFGVLPIPLSLLYFIFQVPLNLPFVGFWTLTLVALVSSVGLSILLPNRWKKTYRGAGQYNGWDDDGDGWGYDNGSNNYDDSYEGTSEDRFDRQENEGSKRPSADYNSENNPTISVSFGEANRYLHANALKTARLKCSFGSLEVYFDQAELHPDGAEVFVECSFGSVELYVPRHWRIINETRCTLGAAEINNKRFESVPNPPTLTVYGNVSLGALEISRIK